MATWKDPTTGTSYSYPRDVELASIQYDSPGCLNAQTMCTGSSWAPQMQVVFNASHSPTTLTGTAPSGCNTGSHLRCDDPLDLSSSGGVAAPLIQSTYVLNSVQVQVRTSGSGTWNPLSTYKLGYEQSGPSTITDPASGLAASVAGMLDLTQFQQVGSDGSTTLPMVTFAYTSLTNYYEDVFFKPNPSTNCGPSWNTGTGSGCLLWEQSYANNSRFLASTSNGQGLAQTFSWTLARNNNHGVPGGGSNNATPFYCDSHQTTSPCQEVDDSGWSHAVLTSESDTTVRLTQNGQQGAQNGEDAFPGNGNWNSVQSETISVSLKAGSNTLLFANPSDWAPQFDRIVVNGTSYEAESSANTLAGGARVQSCSVCSGGEQVVSVGFTWSRMRTGTRARSFPEGWARPTILRPTLAPVAVTRSTPLQPIRMMLPGICSRRSRLTAARPAPSTTPWDVSHQRATLTGA